MNGAENFSVLRPFRLSALPYFCTVFLLLKQAFFISLQKQLSHTPRNMWDNGKIQSNATSFGLWTREAAEATEAVFIDLNRISGERRKRPVGKRD